MHDINVCVCEYARMLLQVCVCVLALECVRVCMRMCLSVCVYVCVCACIFSCVHICLSLCVFPFVFSTPNFRSRSPLPFAILLAFCRWRNVVEPGGRFPPEGEY